MRETAPAGAARRTGAARWRRPSWRAGLRPRYEPVVSLRTHEVVGFRAPAGMPSGSSAPTHGEPPVVREAQPGGVDRPGRRLFLDAGPALRTGDGLRALREHRLAAAHGLEVVVDVTPRDGAQDVGALVASVAGLRAVGGEVALQVSGADPAGTALLTVLEPDVVVLGAALLDATDPSPRRVLGTAVDHAQRTGAVLLVTGVGSRRQRRRAVEVGAHWAHGAAVGRPRPIAPGRAAARGAAGARPEVVDLVPRPRPGLHEELVDPRWVAEHLRQLLEAARDGAAGNVLLLQLPAEPTVPLGFFEELAELQQSCALAVVFAGRGAGAPVSGPAADRPDLVAVLFGASTCRSLLATRATDGRFRVRVDTRPERVSALSRELLGQS